MSLRSGLPAMASMCLNAGAIFSNSPDVGIPDKAVVAQVIVVVADEASGSPSRPLRKPLDRIGTFASRPQYCHR